MSKPDQSRRDLLLAAAAVTSASLGIEGLQHWLMAQSSMTLYHAVSALLTVLLVAVAVWQRDLRVRWIEAQARSEDLARANAELRLALKELSRSDQLAAAGASAAALSERLRELMAATECGAMPHSHLDDLELILDELQALAQTSRRTMRPVDVGSLLQWALADVTAGGAIEAYCLVPDHPVWVKANPARLEMAFRHFIAHSARIDSAEHSVIVVDTGDGCATIALAGPKGKAVEPNDPDALNWRIARAVVAECGGSVTVTDEPDGRVYTIYLPLGPVPQSSPPTCDEPIEAIRDELRLLAAQDQSGGQNRPSTVAAEHPSRREHAVSGAA